MVSVRERNGHPHRHFGNDSFRFPPVIDDSERGSCFAATIIAESDEEKAVVVYVRREQD